MGTKWIITVRSTAYDSARASLENLGARRINGLKNLDMFTFEFDGTREDIVNAISDIETCEMDRVCSCS
jgi:hypothetical protein